MDKATEARTTGLLLALVAAHEEQIADLHRLMAKTNEQVIELGGLLVVLDAQLTASGWPSA